MNIQILQGINFENNCTTIKIDLNEKAEKQKVEKIINKIKEFHRVFLKKYEINNNQLIIQSKLPYLWKEIGEILHTNRGEEEMLKEILGNPIKKQLSSMSTIPVLDIADTLNEEITPFLKLKDRFRRQYTIGCGQRTATIISFSSSKDSAIAKKIQMDKNLTNRLIERLNLPIAKWELIESEKDIEKILKKYKKPVVIKPISLTSGNGVHTNIHNLTEAIKAYKDAKEKIKRATTAKNRDKILIQQQVEGDDYRLLIVNGVLEATTQRVPAFVLGNGKSDIGELVRETNTDETRNTLSPTHTLKPILIDNLLIDYLGEQGFNLKSIPQLNKKIYLRKIASMSQGGITIDYTEQTSKQIKYIVESIAQSINAYVLGIDIICKDISKPLTIENGSIIEINTMPEAYLNLYPLIGKQRPEIAAKFLKGLLANKPKTKKIVIIGSNKDSRPEVKGNTGIYYNNNIYINNELINKNIALPEALESLKINSYLNNIVVHYKNIKEPKMYGLGFNEIDELYFEKKYENEIKKILDNKLIKKYEILNN